MAGRRMQVVAGFGWTVRGRVDKSSKGILYQKYVYEVAYKHHPFKPLEDSHSPTEARVAKALSMAKAKIRCMFRTRLTKFIKKKTCSKRMLPSGKAVHLHGLKVHSQLNGEKGLCEEWDVQRDRLRVHLANGQQVWVMRGKVMFDEPNAWMPWLPKEWVYRRRLTSGGRWALCFVGPDGLSCWSKRQVEQVLHKKLGPEDGVPAPEVPSSTSASDPHAQTGVSSGSAHAASDVGASSASAFAASEVGAASSASTDVHPTTSTSDSSTGGADAKCVVCLNNAATHIVVPCGHQLLCHACAQLEHLACPYCRGSIHQIIKVFVVGELDEAAMAPAIQILDGAHTLAMMGFDQELSRAALQSAEGDVQMAIAMLCSEQSSHAGAA